MLAPGGGAQLRTSGPGLAPPGLRGWGSISPRVKATGWGAPPRTWQLKLPSTPAPDYPIFSCPYQLSFKNSL